jgi:hypothetical protein
VADVPDELTLRRNRDLEGREKRPWVRRALLTIVAALLILALLNVFGQRPGTSKAASRDATLTLYATSRIRSGLYYEARFRVRALRELKDARLVLDPGWLEGMTVNTIEPGPVGEASDNGRLSFDLGHIPAGGSYLLFIQTQVNPTNVGRRSQDVRLYDGKRLLTTLDRTITIFP